MPSKCRQHGPNITGNGRHWHGDKLDSSWLPLKVVVCSQIIVGHIEGTQLIKAIPVAAAAVSRSNIEHPFYTSGLNK